MLEKIAENMMEKTSTELAALKKKLDKEFTPEQKKLLEITGKQINALRSADLPAELKLKIEKEFLRLITRHPNWKRHRAIRIAGEKFNVKFLFNEKKETDKPIEHE